MARFCREDDERERAEEERAKTMRDLSERVEDIQKTQRKLSEDQIKELQEANNLYRKLAESADESRKARQQELLRQMAKDFIGIFGAPHENAVGSSMRAIVEFLKAALLKKRTDRDDIRKAADSLMLSALGVPKKDLPIS